MSKKQTNLVAEFKSLVMTTYTNWRNDRTLRLGAGLSYYVIFSLVPTLALSVFFASILFPKEEVVGFVGDKLSSILGEHSTGVTEYLAQDTVIDTVESGFSSLGLFGIIALVVTASFAMIALLDSVNIIWGRPVEKGWRNMVRRYAFSYMAVLTVALFLIIILTVQAVLNAVETIIGLDGPIIEFLTNTITTVIIWSLLIFALAWLLRVLSGSRVGWLYAIVGSAITIFFMYLGVKGIGFYLTNFSFKSVTSAFSAVLLILVWVYYESQILLAGFQLTKTMSEGKYHQK